jgi:circadian clock protein KaiC
LGLNHLVSTGRLSSGVPGVDGMLGRRGYFRGSSVLISGGAGTGKTSLAGYFIDSACRRKESSLYFAFEESSDQVARNLKSIGLDIEPWIRSRRLQVHAARPTTSGLEGHLSTMLRMIEENRPRVVVVDPISNLISVGTSIEVKAMLARLIDIMKVRQVTALFTSLTSDEGHPAEIDMGISSFMDTWLVLRNVERNGERTRSLAVLKSRGMPHSNQVREFALTSRGMELVDVVRDRGRVLVGSERIAHLTGRAHVADQHTIPRMKR